MERRDFLKTSVGAAAGLIAAGTVAASPAAAAGSTTTVKGKTTKVTLGFIALTDAAPLIMAKEQGFFAARGLDVTLVKQASWPATRDNILKGQIDGGHVLSSMPLSVASKVGGDGSTTMKTVMILNNNGQAITLDKSLSAAGYGDLAAAKKVLETKNPTLAMTFPGGTHDTWLRYWLKATKATVKSNIIPIPPPQMVANMKVGTMDGYCVGEPWNAVAVVQNIGFTHLASQDIWTHHPEKALVLSDAFIKKDISVVKALMGAVLDACKWLDKSDSNRRHTAVTIAAPSYLNTTAEAIAGRLTGTYDLGAGLGQKKFTDTDMKFHRGGLVNMPRQAHAKFFLASYQRFGLITKPNYDLAAKLWMTDLYMSVAQAEKIALPDDNMKPFTLKLDGAVFDPAKPHDEATRA